MDEVTLTLPPEPDFHRIAHLVVGGLAVRLDLTYDVLEDLTLALDELLARARDGDDLTLSVGVEGAVLRASIGPFAGDSLRDELGREVNGDGMSLRRLLETVADRVDVSKRDEGVFVELRKTVQTRSEVA